MENTMILYSMIIAVYNVEQYLEECLESILRQEYDNWECILVDDGSTDGGSGKICDTYAKKDSRFRVFHRNNEGSLFARRFGFLQSSGEYVLFIDSDDYIHKDLLKEVNYLIQKNRCDLLVYRFQWVNQSSSVDSEVVFPEGTLLGKDNTSKNRLWKRAVTCNSLNNLWTKVTKRECVDIEVDYTKFASLKSGTDLLQSLSILDRADKIYFTEKIFYYYRNNASGISSNKGKNNSLNEINKYFKNRKQVMREREAYIKKNTNSEEILRLHYCSYFKNSMEILVSWLLYEKNHKKKKQIVFRVIREKDLIECTQYILLKDMNGCYKALYLLFKKNHFAGFYLVSNILVLYKKAIMIKGTIEDRIIQK